jgi:peroxiredoxin
MKRRDAMKGLGLLTLGAAAKASPAVPAVGDAVTWPGVMLLDGSTWDAKRVASNAVVVVFWSTTCPFCQRHNQHVEKLHRQAQGRALKVLGVARDRNDAAVRRFAAAQGYSFPITTDHARLAAALGPRNVIPLTVTVDRQGRLQRSFPGEMFESDVLEFLRLAA